MIKSTGGKGALTILCQIILFLLLCDAVVTEAGSDLFWGTIGVDSDFGVFVAEVSSCLLVLGATVCPGFEVLGAGVGAGWLRVATDVADDLWVLGAGVCPGFRVLGVGAILDFSCVITISLLFG